MVVVAFGGSERGDSLNGRRAVTSQGYFFLLPLLPVVFLSGFFAMNADFPDFGSGLGTWITFLGSSYLSAKAAGVPI